MIKYYIAVLSAIVGLALPGEKTYMQEICDNGIDDDMDGLIDLNDTVDCFCTGLGDTVFVPASLIPNYSFEDTICCPRTLQQLHCAEKWIQASRATSDYYHTCGYTHNDARGEPPQPLPSGDAYVGFLDTYWLDTIIWKEYIGACLDKPMETGKNYRLQFYFGFAVRGDYYGSRSPFTVALYGTEDCVHLPFGDVNYTRCPSNLPEWFEIGRVTMRGRREWVRAQMNFTVDREINAVAIGPTCADPHGEDYYFLDELVLNERVSFDDFQFDILGETCDSLIRLWTSDVQNIDYQWYRNGVAIQGATDPELFITNRDDGVFILRASDGINCELSNEFHHFPIHSETHIDTSICQGQQLVLFNQVYEDERQDTFYLSNRFGCDSTVFLDVRLKDTSIANMDTTICEGEQIVVAGTTFSDAGRYRLTSTNAEGCDSFIYLTINLADTFHISRDTLLCPGAGFEFNGQWIDSSGMFHFNFQSAEACDSVVTWRVNIADDHFQVLDSFICSGRDLSLSDTVVNTPGVYLRTLHNQWGCDSLVEWHIEALDFDTIRLDTLMCWGEAIIWQGQTFDKGGEYSTWLSSTESCDTLAILSITEVMPYEVVSDRTLEVDCHDDVITSYELRLNPPCNYEIIWEDGTIGPQRFNLGAGIYRYYVQDIFECDLVDSLVINAPLPLTMDIEAVNPDCNDEASGRISVSNITGGNFPYRIFINGEENNEDLTDLKEGPYNILVTDSRGCRYDTSLTLENIDRGEMYLSYLRDTFVVGDPIIIRANVSGISSIVITDWNGPEELCSSCLSDTLLLGPGDYEISLLIIDGNGCEYYDVLQFTVIQQYWVPNAFTPNGDFLNDFFNVYTDRSIEIIDELYIFDRWGEILYKGENIPPGNFYGWDGFFNGELMQPGVYVYLANFRDKVGTSFQVSGDVTLVR